MAEKEELYQDQYGVATGMMFGFDKTQFAISSVATDFAVIRIRTASVNPA